MNMSRALHRMSWLSVSKPGNCPQERGLSQAHKVASAAERLRYTAANGKEKHRWENISSILTKELDLTASQRRRFYRAGAVELLDNVILQERLFKLKEMGFTKQDIKSELSLLFIPSKEIVVRKEILEECGVHEVAIKLLSRYDVLSRKRIRLLKAGGLIPQETNVPEKILSFVGEDIPPPSFSSLRKAQYLSTSATADAVALGDVHKYTLLHYMAWYTRDAKLAKSRARFKPKSLRQVKRSFDALRSLNVENEKLAKCLSLTRCDPRVLSDLLYRYPSIAGRDMKDIIRNHPRIALCTASHVRAILKSIEEYGFAEEMVAVYPNLLLLDPEAVRQGLRFFKSIPDLWALRHSGNISRLLYHRDLIPKLQYVKGLPVEVVPSISILTSSPSSISSLLERRVPRSHINEFLQFLATELRSDVREVRDIISRHARWRQGSAVVMSETLTFLRSRGFDDQDILPNCAILLYPRWYVEGVVTDRIGAVPERPSRIDLALCLYDIEKARGFAGEGVATHSDDEGKQI